MKGSESMYQHPLQKTVRRLEAAEGYLELDLPNYALDELEAISDPGPFEPLIHYMKGDALKEQRRFQDAIEPLTQAARLIPAPHNRIAWKALGECYRQGGQDELADVVEMFADSPPVADAEERSLPHLTINIVFQRDSIESADDQADENVELN